MWPQVGPIPTYALAYFAGFLAHVVLSLLIARRLRLKWYVPVLMSACYALGMTLGAKALYDLRSGEFVITNLLQPNHYLQGGLWGGALAYLVLAAPIALAMSGNRPGAFDLMALSLPIPMAIAKIGCFCNGCCYGTPSSAWWAIHFSRSDIPAPADVGLHPTQLYEVLILLLAAAVMYRSSSPNRRGLSLFWFLAIYGIGRPLTELVRGDIDPQTLWGFFTPSQLICLLGAVTSIGVLIAHHLLVHHTPRREVA